MSGTSRIMAALIGHPLPVAWWLQGASLVRACRAFVISVCFVAVAACGKETSPLVPTTTTSNSSNLTPPTPDAPADQAALASYRPTLVVRNGTSTQSGTRVYVPDSDGAIFDGVSRVFTVLRWSPTAPAPLKAVAGRRPPDLRLQPHDPRQIGARMLQGTDLSDGRRPGTSPPRLRDTAGPASSTTR